MKKTILNLILLAISVSSNAQDFLGYVNSNYSGVSGLELQPAAVVDSRYRVDICIIGFSASLYNNYLGLSRDVLKISDNFDEDLFKEDYVNVRNNKRDKSFYFSSQYYLPSVLISINNSNAFALKGKVRGMFNLDGLSPELASFLYVNSGNSPASGQQFYNKKLNVSNMVWIDYGFTFGHVFKAEGPHFFKGGTTIKLLQGLQASYMYLDNMGYQSMGDEISVSDSDIGFGYSDTENDLKFSPSAGFDFGAVYEWRPDYEKYMYDMDGKSGLYRKDKNKYKLRVGFSIVDIGIVKFKNARGASGKLVNSDSTNADDLQSDNPFNIVTTPQTIRMNLPTVISAQIDYNIHKNFYVNFTPYVALKFRNKNTKVHDITTFSISPRWDHKWFGVYTPVSYDLMGNTKIGLGLRIGPLIFGTNSLGPWMMNKPIYGADFHVLLKVPILYGRPKDRDNDKVSNRKDKCRDVAGTWEFRGCPDRDGDHILDIEDDCPDAPGLPKFKGCPDTDNDSIIDKTDRCPDIAGPLSNGGCPELKLSLVDSAGNILQTVKAEKNGNFIFENLPADDLAAFKLSGENTDTTSTVKVIVRDNAKTAIRDNNDRLFRFPIIPKDTLVSPALLIKKDSVINTNVSDAAMLERTIGNFAFAKAVIKAESYPALDELATLMKKNPDWKLKISGFTDNLGSDKFNMNLSRKRAEAVKKQLISRGVSSGRLAIKSMGSTQPIANNETEEGRLKNRRVELLIITK